MKTITQDEFEQLCTEVAADAKEMLIAELFSRVCRHVGLEPEMQKADLPGNYAFALAQTLEDNMWPTFYYPEVMNKLFPFT